MSLYGTANPVFTVLIVRDRKTRESGESPTFLQVREIPPRGSRALLGHCDLLAAQEAQLSLGEGAEPRARLCDARLDGAIALLPPQPLRDKLSDNE